MNYKTEFPRFPKPLPKLKGFEDSSWHNDACPSLTKDLGEFNSLRLFVNYPNPKDREIGDYKYILFYEMNDGLITKLVCESNNLKVIKKSINKFFKGF
jgi:hypothetical protein